MEGAATVTVPSEPDLRRFQHRILFRLRWATIVVLLLITLLLPRSSHVAFPIWMLVLAFALYNLLHDLLRTRLPPQFSFAWLALLDLLVAGLLYFLGGLPLPDRQRSVQSRAPTRRYYYRPNGTSHESGDREYLGTGK